MAKVSAGLVMYRERPGRVEVLLVHPGGPLWAKKDLGAWSIPKGEVGQGEDEFATARREFEEETGVRPEGEFTDLGTITQRGGKVVRAWAFEGECDPACVRSNNFVMEWPPRSGKQQEFPEIDRAQFFGIDEAKRRINPGQAALLVELEKRVLSRPRKSAG